MSWIGAYRVVGLIARLAECSLGTNTTYDQSDVSIMQEYFIPLHYISIRTTSLRITPSGESSGYVAELLEETEPVPVSIPHEINNQSKNKLTVSSVQGIENTLHRADYSNHSGEGGCSREINKWLSKRRRSGGIY